MNVASLELCKELHELSGWKANYALYRYEFGVRTRLEPAYELFEPDDGYMIMYAYDLGYLLRKLPENSRWVDYSVTLRKWVCFGDHSADTPEDVLAAYAIELFKQNILIKEAK